MANIAVVIPNEINRILNERANIWNKLIESQTQFKELEKLSAYLQPGSSPAEIPSELTDEKTPPSEIAAALQSFQAELEVIQKAQEDIKIYEAELNRIKRQRMIVGIVVGLILAILVCAAVFGGVSFIKSLLSR
jgi:hypothetical protein